MDQDYISGGDLQKWRSLLFSMTEDKHFIKASRIKKELITLLICFIAAFGLNIFSIVKDKTGWNELADQLDIVLLVAILLYVLVLMFRLFAWGINRLFSK
ncbi:MAG: hypothetical protein ABFS16_10130 [Bacteroidota bacterium]